MSRPRREDRESVANVTLPIRVTEAERAKLATIVDIANAKQPSARATAASVVRWLIEREAHWAGVK